MIAYIIFVNDTPQAAVIDNEQLAHERMKTLEEEYSKKNPQHSINTTLYWHVHDVPVLL